LARKQFRENGGSSAYHCMNIGMFDSFALWPGFRQRIIDYSAHPAACL